MNRWFFTSLLMVSTLTLSPIVLAKGRSKGFSLDEVTLSEIERTLDAGLRSGNMAIRAAAYRGVAISNRPKKDIEATLLDGLKDPQAIVVAGVVDGMLSRKMKGFETALIQTLAAEELSWNDVILPLLSQLSSKQRVSTLVDALNAKGLRGKNRIALEGLKRGGQDAIDLLMAGEKAGGEAASLLMNTLSDLSPSYALDLYPLVIQRGSDAAKLTVLGQASKLPSDVSLDFLTPLLATKNAAVKEKVSFLLAPRGHQAAASNLLPVALDETRSERDRVAALQGMQGAVSPGMLSSLRALLDDAATPAAVKGGIYGCFAKAGDASVLENIRADLSGTDGNLRAAASRWLGTLEGPSAVPVLQELLLDGNEAVRQNAAFSLGEMRSLDMIPMLEQGLRDVSPEVKLETMKAFAKVRNNQVAEIVQFLAFDGDSRIRRETLQILAASKHVATISTLENLLTDADMDIRMDALLAIMDTDLEKGKSMFKRSLLWLKPNQLLEIARRQGQNYVGYAAIALDSRKEDIRSVAIEGLRYLPQKTQDDLLLSFKDSTKFPDVRAAAYLSFSRLNWDEALPVFEQWLTSVETPNEDLETAFTALEAGKPSQRVVDALKAGFVLNESFQTRATLALLRLTRR